MSYLLREAVGDVYALHSHECLQEPSSRHKIQELVLLALTVRHKAVYGANVGFCKDESNELFECRCNNCIWIELGAPFSFIADAWHALLLQKTQQTGPAAQPPACLCGFCDSKDPALCQTAKTLVSASIS